MEHLSNETLARLVDETPTEEERIHLDGCPPCAGELEELRQQTGALGSLPDMRPPPGDWEVLQARMVSEGLVRWSGRRGGLATTPRWMRAAAALLLFVGGAAMGGLAVRGPMVANYAGTVPGGPAALSMAGQASTPEEAAELVRLAERQYMDALVQYRQLDATDMDASPNDAAAKFAAIEMLVQISQAAVREVPTDPFFNGVLASARAERAAQLRRISVPGEDNWY